MLFLILAVFLVLLYLLVETAVRGRKIGVVLQNRYFPENIGRHLNGLVNSTGHRRYATTATVIAVVAVVATEIFIRLHGGANGGPLFLIHLCFAIPFFLTLLTLRFYATGTRSPRVHRILAYSCCAAFVGALSTGAPLLFFKSLFS